MLTTNRESAFNFGAFTRAAISNDPKENPPESGSSTSGLMIMDQAAINAPDGRV
jgi:hypothetical protein